MPSIKVARSSTRPRPRKSFAWRLPLLTLLSTVATFAFFVWIGHASKEKSQRRHFPIVYEYKIVNEYPHDPEAFTQGLEYNDKDDTFWESTGLNGESSLRRVDIHSGNVLEKVDLEEKDFGEGLTRLRDYIYQVTWLSPRMWRYAAADIREREVLETPLSDGWGLTTNGTHLIVSDSSDTLSFLKVDEPSLNVELAGQVRVSDGGAGVPYMNELEYIDGEIWGNVYTTPCIARVDPSSGLVKGWIVLNGLKGHMQRSAGENKERRADVLNGIAWDGRHRRLFLTGKLWPRMYEIQVVKAQDQGAEYLERVRARCIVKNVNLG